MQRMSMQNLALACAAALSSGAAFAADIDHSELTLYRSDNAALYASSGDGVVDDGHAVVRERRALSLKSGSQDIMIGSLPNNLDAEALALSFPDDQASVLSQRLLLAQGNNAALTGLIGSTVEVIGDTGQSLANGTLLRVDNGLLVQGANGNTLVNSYSAVRSASGDFPTGSSLRLRVDAKRAGQADAVLSYPTSGLGWRAAYVAVLQPGDSCKMQFESRASIANRSGRDWKDTKLTLIAGEPNFAKASAPRPVMMMRAMAAAPSSDLPQQGTLADYRSYSLPAPVDLPDGSVSQVPLYAPRTLDCERTSLYENGGTWSPPQPMLSPDDNSSGNNTVISTLRLRAFDSLPAGYLRVLTNDSHGTAQFIGEGRIEDTPKGSDATITLGTAFDLRVARERTAFQVDKAARTMDESFRLTLSNAGNGSRIVTVREHPSRWRQWTLTSSSSKPSKQTPDTLEFRVNVPANGQATLDYTVRYQWTADQQPQS